ncbi:hypothetical protein AC791_15470 [Klebsiella sp. RIT-PI-d]|uniref:hypothetical protein n=1 Tax=Klebsiella sp. RIT-PI-d TaxID=1681196 RepID=UPI000675EF96|nr:hypothetical protein [Klebsiella sp. RIT-PI-d]KNC10007.1 hypothetical protein AC791_15470 [Klebsiella sp. RIT-PI-d]
MDCVNITLYGTDGTTVTSSRNCFTEAQVESFFSTANDNGLLKNVKAVWTIFNGGVKGPSGNFPDCNPPWQGLANLMKQVLQVNGFVYQPDSPDNDGPGDGGGLFGDTDVDGNPIKGEDGGEGGGGEDGGEGGDDDIPILVPDE